MWTSAHSRMPALRKRAAGERSAPRSAAFCAAAGGGAVAWSECLLAFRCLRCQATAVLFTVLAAQPALALSTSWAAGTSARSASPASLARRHVEAP